MRPATPCLAMVSGRSSESDMVGMGSMFESSDGMQVDSHDSIQSLCVVGCSVEVGWGNAVIVGVVRLGGGNSKPGGPVGVGSVTAIWGSPKASTARTIIA